MDITIKIGDSEVIQLKKRAKKNMFTLKEQVEDIVRRSCINSKNNTPRSSKCDDALVGIFSRERTGRKKKL